MARPVDTPELARKREREAQMVSQMIALWCRGHHGGGMWSNRLAAMSPCA